MAGGTYKSGVQIDLIYQAAALLSNAIPVGTVLDEAGAVHSAETTGLTSNLLAGELSGVAEGRYHGHFTPDAEGRWTVIIQDKNGNGEVSKVYNVAGHDLDSVGDAVAALDTADTASQLLITQSAINAATASDNLLKQSAIVSSVKSNALVTQSTISGYISDVESALNVAISDIDALGAEDIASQLLLTKSSLVSAVLADLGGVEAAVTSQLLITQSAINAATASDNLLKQSTISGYISNVESAVDLIGSAAMVS